VSAADKHAILLVEDNPAMARVYQEYLKRRPYEVVAVDTGKDALAALAQQSFSIVLLDLHLPDMAGIEILKEAGQQENSPAVIVITANGSIGTAVEAMREGAYDFLVKPFAQERILVTIENALERQRLKRIVTTYAPGAQASQGEDFCGFIGESLAMRQLYRLLELAAQSKASVFVTGESGTGKELCAEAIHRLSPRAKKPFIALNCAAMPKDLVESEIFGHVKGAFTGAVADREGAASRAQGGTLFFDEIGEMDIALQAKLLRFIQTGQFQKVGGSVTEKADVRFICATNRDPLSEIEAGRFREDLYYRLYVMPINLPPLRERGDDILVLARSFLTAYAQEEGRDFRAFSPEAERILLSYLWPGNVRQLQNFIRQAVLLNVGAVMTPEMLPPPLNGAAPTIAAVPSAQPMAVPPIAPPAPVEAPPRRTHPGGRFSIAVMERELIDLALAEAEGNVAKAAELLDISPSTLYRKREVYYGFTDTLGLAREVKPMAEMETDLIRTAVQACNGNITKTASELGINPSTLYRKLQTLGLRAE
jgi:two-component system repressor protein LuxO